MSSKNKVPAIRFKEFSGGWENKKLGEICLIGDIDHRMPQSVNNGIPYLMTGDFIGINDLNFDNAKLISIEDYERLSKKIKPEKGDILFARYASVGAVRFVETHLKFTVSYSCAILKNSANIDGLYLFYSLQSNKVQHQVELEINAGSQKNIGIDSLKKIIITFPENKEQVKLSCFIKKLNTLICQHQKKHDKLLSIKKSLLEKMFPKQGEKDPGIRFSGFSGEWERKILGDIGSSYSGLSGKTKDDFGHGQGRFITYMNVFSNTVVNKSLLEPIEIDSKQNEVKQGDFLFTISSETPDEVGMSSVWMEDTSNVYLNSFCFGLRPTQKIDHYYLVFMLRSSSFRKQMTVLAQGISRYNISKNKAMDLQIRIPNVDEQTKIGKFFNNLEILINQHQFQIKKLNNIKKSFLEKMFV